MQAQTGPDVELCDLAAADLAALVRERAVSPVEIVQSCLRRLEYVQPVLNPFCFIYPEDALRAAAEAERAVMAARTLGPLHGVPIALKDFTPTAGRTTTRGSYGLRDWMPERDPVIVRRLRAAGAILIGKTTTPEFAHSSFTRSTLWGHTRNPWDRSRTSGGSSGGSAVAVATGCVALAEGTDMGGSVRIPAALCGLVGLKPSLGRIPMDILPTVFDLISHFGPLARTVRDAALFLAATEGPDDADILSQDAPRPLPTALDGDMRGLRIALSVDLGFFHVDDEVTVNLHAVAEALRGAGAIVDRVTLDWTAEVVRAWSATWEVYLAAAAGEVMDAHRDSMDPDLVALIEAGRRRDAVSFKRLEEVRTRQWHALAHVLADHDALLCPTMARTAPPIEARDSDFEAVDADGRLHGLDMTAPFNNVAQCPALSVPSGLTRDGLPTGVQIVGRRFDDPTVLRIGAAIERLRPWPRAPVPG